MNYEDTVKRAEKLRKDLNYYSYRYYVDNEMTLTTMNTI